MIQISPSALNRIQDMLHREGNSATTLFIRFGVKHGGCSGMTYGLGFDDAE